MNSAQPKNSFWHDIWLTTVGISFIIFLLYSVLLMREFTSGHGGEKTLMMALSDIVTKKSFAIALVSASMAFFAHKYVQKRS